MKIVPSKARKNNVYINTSGGIHVVNSFFFLISLSIIHQRYKIQEVQFQNIPPAATAAVDAASKGGFEMYNTLSRIMYLIIDSLFALLTGALCINTA